MKCPYCDGSEKLPIDDFATDCWTEAYIEGVGSEVPAIWVLADGESIYIRIKRCPMCGRDLTGDDE